MWSWIQEREGWMDDSDTKLAHMSCTGWLGGGKKERRGKGEEGKRRREDGRRRR
jgi:hypothetical protein